MPKRKNRDSDEYIMRKIRKLEKKVKERSRRQRKSSSPDNSDAGLSLLEDNQQNVYVEEPIAIVEEPKNGTINTVAISPTKEIEHSISQCPVESEQQMSDSINDIPSTSVEQNETELVLDDNILELLGETPSKNKKYSSPIQNELSVRWEHIATTGLQKDLKKELLDKYLLPENCKKIGSPQLNAEIKAALSDTLVKKDKAIEIKQNQQAISISCIGQALTKIFASQNKDTDIIRLLLDAGRLLCDHQYMESMSRRSFVTSTIRKDIKDHLYTTEIDSHLFGEKLTDTLKSAKAISKSGAEIKNISQTKMASVSQQKYNQSRSLNMRPPLPLARQSGAGRRFAPTSLQPRRYQAHPPPLPPPPPPATLTYQAPPPPPPPPASSQRSRARTQIRR